MAFKQQGAYEIPNLRFTGIAKQEIKLRRFVCVDTDGTFTLSGSKVVIGASLNHVNAACPIEVADGICIVEAAAVISAGTNVSSDANGLAIPFTTGTLAGVALTGATAIGQYITVKL